MKVDLGEKEYLQIYINISDMDEIKGTGHKMEKSYLLGCIYRRKILNIHGIIFQDRWIELEWLVPVEKIKDFMEIWYNESADGKIKEMNKQ